MERMWGGGGGQYKSTFRCYSCLVLFISVHFLSVFFSHPTATLRARVPYALLKKWRKGHGATKRILIGDRWRRAHRLKDVARWQWRRAINIAHDHRHLFSVFMGKKFNEVSGF